MVPGIKQHGTKSTKFSWIVPVLEKLQCWFLHFQPPHSLKVISYTDPSFLPDFARILGIWNISSRGSVAALLATFQNFADFIIGRSVEGAEQPKHENLNIIYRLRRIFGLIYWCQWYKNLKWTLTSVAISGQLWLLSMNSFMFSKHKPLLDKVSGDSLALISISVIYEGNYYICEWPWWSKQD